MRTTNGSTRRDSPGSTALESDRIVGHVSYRIVGDRCEITSIDATPLRNTGVGTRLLEAVLDDARTAGCRKARLTTTNDNLDALRFYQRRGFRLIALRLGAVDQARSTLKPEIPVIGAHGILMTDELDLELELRVPDESSVPGPSSAAAIRHARAF